jgi:hypothetical protein
LCLTLCLNLGGALPSGERRRPLHDLLDDAPTLSRVADGFSPLAHLDL